MAGDAKVVVNGLFGGRTPKPDPWMADTLE